LNCITVADSKTNFGSRMSPLVSVIIPAYNAERTLQRAIDSVLAQDYQPIEIIVVDDGSKDGTSEIAAGYLHNALRLLRLPRNRGEGGVLNEGIANAKGEYIAFLDADDEWLPTKLTRQVAVLESNSAAIMATCGCRFVDASGNLVEEFGMCPPAVAKNQIWRSLLAATSIAKPCVVVRASAFKQLGAFDTTVLIMADQDMWIRLASAGEVEFVDEYLTVAHDTPGSLTKVYRKDEDKYGLRVVRRHLDAQRARLSRGEIRYVLQERYTCLGRNIYLAGRIWRGGWLLLRAMAIGGHRRDNLWYLVTASPPARLAKRILFGSASSQPSSHLRLPPIKAVLAPRGDERAELPQGPPILVVGIDLEAEFDWQGPRTRTNNTVKNVRQQVLVHRIFEKFGIRPIYLVDYAVATDAEGYLPLRELASSDKCEIGAHLQPWENPPFSEEINDQTSYNQNLPAWLQKEKLYRLTEALRSNIGIQPVTYRAGRYGIGEEIAWILRSLGYRIDMSAVPGLDLRAQYGPDFRQVFNSPYWFGPEGDLLEIPLTAGFCGMLSSRLLPRQMASCTYDFLAQPGLRLAHGRGLVARLGLLERITLTPEGISLREMKRLSRSLLSRGHRVFSLNYHSSSLLPGNTPYVRTLADRDRFLAKIEAYLDVFFGEYGGVAMTPTELYAIIRKPRGPSDSIVGRSANALRNAGFASNSSPAFEAKNCNFG
jgi:glycosyltransferase involved in cell wall biosynthesis